MKKQLLLMMVLSCASTSVFAASKADTPDLTDLRAKFTHGRVNYTIGRQMLKVLQTIQFPKTKPEIHLIVVTEANRVLHKLNGEVEHSMDPDQEKIKEGVLDAVRRFFYLLSLAEKLKDVDFVQFYLTLTEPRS